MDRRRNRADRTFACLAFVAISVSIAFACAGRKEGAGPNVGTSDVSTTTSASAPVVGPPLDFILDPLEKETEHGAESETLRGKKAIVLVLTTYDFGSLAALRQLAPLLRALPADTACLQVAMQPLGDRPLISAFMDAEKTPCRRAIGDASRGRLGDLAKVKVVPSVLVLNKDGTLVGGKSGDFDEKTVKDLLDKAK